MKIAIIGSGGDGSGMNNCLYQLVKGLTEEEVVFFNRGFQGILDNDLVKLSIEDLKRERTNGGIIIKTSRCADFKTEKGMQKAISNLKKLNIDLLIILGGNGSLFGAKDLIKRNFNVIFIPTTIDNDIVDSDYSIGFDTAVSKACEFIETVSTSMYSLNRVCIYEVMGRDCPDIARTVAKKTGACYCYVIGSKKEECLRAVKTALKKESSPFVVLQEHTENIEILREYLDNSIKQEVKSCVVGYFQRGGKPTRYELKMGKGFATMAIRSIKNGQFNKMIVFNGATNKFGAKNILN